MAKCSVGTGIGCFLVGVGIGGAVALLFAPKSGEQTRKLIAKKAEEGRGYVSSKGWELKDQAGEMVEKGKDLVNKQRERLAEVLGASKEAARNTLSIV
ncbi:MAG: YtxH domain-containing protein [Terriglobia bacterium]|jgi:gas vesicle protein